MLACLGYLREPYSRDDASHRALADQWKGLIREQGLDPAALEHWQKHFAKAAPPSQNSDRFTDLLACYDTALLKHNKSVSYDRSPYGHFYTAYLACGADHRFFVTDTGRMGLGALPAEAGDVVTILNGASVPFLLRPVERGYLVVGSCYCYSVMHGEYARELERMGTIDAETVSIRLR